MPVYKDGNNGTFYVQCYYRDARGSKRHKTKRGFSSEVEAAVWESRFKSLNGGAMDMTFSEFVEVYASEVKPRIREHTWITKEYIINDKLVPFFGDMRMCDVRPIDVIRWQNELTEHRDADGKPWAPTYLRTIVMPAFLCDEMADFIEMRDDVAPDERLFAVTKHFLAHEMERGCKASGVKRIRIHDIRHSHVSLLIEMGFSALAIAERMGHEAVDITYRYAHLFPTKQDEMAAALDGARG